MTSPQQTPAAQHICDCGAEVIRDGAHLCDKCGRPMHGFCGTGVGPEGFGQRRCDACTRDNRHDVDQADQAESQPSTQSSCEPWALAANGARQKKTTQKQKSQQERSKRAAPTEETSQSKKMKGSTASSLLHFGFEMLRTPTVSLSLLVLRTATHLLAPAGLFSLWPNRYLSDTKKNPQI